jgi:hypothetical protein
MMMLAVLSPYKSRFMLIMPKYLIFLWDFIRWPLQLIWKSTIFAEQISTWCSFSSHWKMLLLKYRETQNRVCLSCDTGEVENEYHFFSTCPYYMYISLRKTFLQKVNIKIVNSNRDFIRWPLQLIWKSVMVFNFRFGLKRMHSVL